MKKALAIVLTLALVFAVTAFGKKKAADDIQDAITGDNVTNWAPEQNIITANPLGLAFGYFNANYEKAIGKNNGLGFSAGFDYYDLGGWSWSGGTVGASYNWYFQHHALNGWYAGPDAGLSFASFSYTYDTLDAYYNVVSTKATATSFGIYIGGHGGYRWIWNNGFVLDLSIGLNYTIASAPVINGVTAAYGGVGFGPGANLGYAW